MISRILYLLEERKVSPGEITAVTFTNQAAKELKERLEKQLGSRRSVNRMHIGTFHSLCLDFLKKQGKEFFIADPSALSETAREICKEYGLSITPSQFLNKVSVQKTGAFFNEEPELWEELLEVYQKRLKEENCCDFDDLLLETLKAFREIHSPGNRKKQPCERCFSYLMVDEFQDINPVQYDLIREWNKKGKELFVIGDPDQSIYGFRGSDSGCFLKMKEEFPETCMISLENNYRSTGNILNGALAVIRNNPGMERCLKPWKETGLPVQIAEAPSKRSEAIFVAKEVSRLVGGMDMLEAQEHFLKEGMTGKRSFRDIAVLYRTHHQARILEKCFQQEGIPYIVSGREEFLEDPLIQGSISFFCSLAEPDNPYYKKDALKKLWDLEENEISGSIYEELKAKYQDRWKREKPQKFMQSWIKDLEQEGNPKLQNLADMAIFYPDIRAFLDAVLLDTVLLAVNHHVKNVLNTEKALKDIDTAPSVQLLIQKYESHIAKKETELKKAEKLKVGIYEDLKDGLLDKAEYLKLKQEFDSRIESASEAIQTLRQEILALQDNHSEHYAWMDYFKEFGELQELTRWAAAITINRILVFEDNRIKIVFNFEDAFTQAQELVRGFEGKEGA